MSIKTQVVRARVAPKTKADAERVLRKLGLTISEAINLLLVQIELKKELPFRVNIPNAETRKVLEETDKGIGLIKCKDADDFFGQLGI